MNPIVDIQNVSHRYKTREALKGVNLSIGRGEIFGLLGPNGSGKTTLFRILSTFFDPTEGSVKVEDLDLRTDAPKLRKKIGVVFQAPSLDARLTVRENITFQGSLYGLAGKELHTRVQSMMARLGIADRAAELVQRLSGGLKRRVELAKGLLHNPALLILDEPSTGLDPGARIDLWKYLKELREKEKITILVTTHLMEEAEHCDRLAILNEGKVVVIGSPHNLKKEIGGDILHIQTQDAAELARQIEHKMKIKAIHVNGMLQIEHTDGHKLIASLIENFPGKIDAVTFRKPTLEDVFVHKTGHRFWTEDVL